MSIYETLHEVKNPEQILRQYSYTTALDTFIITITKEDRTPRWYSAETGEPLEHEGQYQKLIYNVYVNRYNYGEIHYVLGSYEDDNEILVPEAIDYIKRLSKEIAEGETDC